MKLVTAEQMRALEQKADESGNTFAQMMEKAGRAVANAVRATFARRAARQDRVLVLVGPGNNGGDGLVCARYLADSGTAVSLYIWKRAGSDDPNLQLCLERNLPVARAEEDKDFHTLHEWLGQHEVVVDALLGTGVTRPIEGLLKDLLHVVQAHISEKGEDELGWVVPNSHVTARARSFIVAVDLPSGLNPDTGILDPSALAADLTVTFAFPKLGQLTFPGAGAVGELVVADIGIPADWTQEVQIEVAMAAEVAARLPERGINTNKGTFGKAMICAGSRNYVGAAFLAGSAATRAGAGLVTLAISQTIQPVVAASVHETTFLPLPDEEGALTPSAIETLVQGIRDYDALLVGPGFGRNPKTIEFVLRFLGTRLISLSRGADWGEFLQSPTVTISPQADTLSPQANVSFPQGYVMPSLRYKLPPLVIDADALYALSQSPGWWTYFAAEGHRAILTPHPGEMATLCGLDLKTIQQDRIGTARRFATQWRQVIVLKGAHTIVAAPDARVAVVPFATPALATAGTGDVLAGTITALLAQKLPPFDAAVAGAYLHGLAGKIAEEEIGKAGAVAGDLLPRLPRAIRSLAIG